MKRFINKLTNFHIALILLFVILAAHIDVVLYSSGQYLSSLNYGDLNYYINIRLFAFSGLFYPLNIIYYFIPVSKAINFSFLIHFFVLSFSSFLWVNNKIRDKFISLAVAIVAAFLSSSYLHACAAHLSNVNTFVWFPLVLYFYDKSFTEKTYKYIFPVSVIICLQIFAGHWQYVYYTAITSLIYVLVFCRNRYTVTIIFSSYLISLFLAAVQLLPSLDFYFNGARQLGEEKKYAYFSKLMYSVTLLFPQYIRYINEAFWENTIYFGTVNLFVIILAITHACNKNILKTFCVVLFLYFLSFKFFSDIADKVIPFFGWFRTPGKLLFFANVLILPVLAYGIKYLLSERLKINKIFAVCCLIIATVSMLLSKEISDFIINMFNYKKIEPIDRCFMYNSVIISGVLLFLFAGLSLLRKYTTAKIILILIIVCEPVIVMRSFIDKYEYENMFFNFSFYKKEAFNEQTRFFYNINLDLISGIENCSASYPDAVKNYVVFMEHLRHQFNIKNLLGLLKCSYIVNGPAEHISSVEKTDVETLNRLNIMYDYKFETDKEKIYDMISDENFNIFDTVILEKEPAFAVRGKGNGMIKPIYFDETSIAFECIVDKPAIILYTDNFTVGWRAYEIDNPEIKYEVICADYIYKAISIDKGYHRIKIEYNPVSFMTGKLISVFSWLIFLFSWLISRKSR